MALLARDFPDGTRSRERESRPGFARQLPGRGGLGIPHQIGCPARARNTAARAGDGGFEASSSNSHRNPFLDDLTASLSGRERHDHHGQIRVGGLDLSVSSRPLSPEAGIIGREVHFPFFSTTSASSAVFRRLDRCRSPCFEGLRQHSKVRFVVDDEDCIHDSAVYWDSIACVIDIGGVGESAFPGKLLLSTPPEREPPPSPETVWLSRKPACSGTR